MLMRVVSILMTFLLFFSVGLQYNDVDPVPWMILYGVAGFVSGVATLVPGRYPWPVPALVGLVSLAWAATIVPEVAGQFSIPDLFASFEMDDIIVEEARECLGLVIVGAWMAVLVVARMIRLRAAPAA